jgi:hypothetical protein
VTEQIGAKPLQAMPVRAPRDAASPTLRQQLADPAALNPLQRLQLANSLALGQVAESAKQTLLHPGKAIAETVKGLGTLLTEPGTMAVAAQKTWQRDRTEGAILSGRLIAGYAGAAGMVIGAGALLGRLGAGAARLPNLAFALQQTGKFALRTAGIAGTTAVGLDLGALAIHEVKAAGATTHKELASAVQGLHGDLSNLTANAATMGLSKAGGMGMKALATSLREQELATSLGATNKAVRQANRANLSLSAKEMGLAKKSGIGAEATLAEELRPLVGRNVKHLNAGERVQLAEYLNQSLSQVEQAAAGKAIAKKLQPGVGIDELIATGEQATWETSGITAETLQALKRKGWQGEQLRGVREAIRGADLREGQQAGAMQRTAERLLQGERQTGSNTRRLQNAVVRAAVLDSLKEVGVTRQLEKTSVADLQHLNYQLQQADPATRTRLVGLLNGSTGKLQVSTFWRQAYEHLYADLGIDPAVFRSLAPKELPLSGMTALEKVYGQLKVMPEASRNRINRAISAVDVKPGDASRIMKQAHVTEMTGRIADVLPKGEKAKAPVIATALVKELVDGEAVRTRGLIASKAMTLPGRLLRGDAKAISSFVRSVGQSKAHTESLIASVTSAVSKLPEATRRQVFAGLSPDRSVGAQLANRLTKVLQDDFGVTVKRTTTSPKVHDELVVADMDAAGALNLYNALEAMAGPNKNLPRLAKQGIFARSSTHDFGGIALDGDDGRKYTALTDQGLVEDSWADPVGTTHAEGIWTHEVGHQMQATGSTAAERGRMADWSKLGDWKHATGQAADGTHPYKRTDNYIYKDPTVGGNTKESVSGYGKTDPAEDWAEFVRIGTADPVSALKLSPPKFLYFATQMAAGWGDRLNVWASQAGVDLRSARQVAAQRLGDGHPALARIDNLLAGLNK